MSAIYLTAAELQGITGYKRVSAQLRWIREQGLKYAIRGDGSVLVSRAHFELSMGGIPPKAVRAIIEPDFSAI